MTSQGYNRLQPKLGAALRAGDMDVAASLFPAVKEKAV